VRLSEEQRREAVALLADLLLAAAAKHQGVGSPGVIDGATDSVIPLAQKRGKGREAA